MVVTCTLRAQRLFKAPARLTGSLLELVECNGTVPSDVLIVQNWTQMYDTRGDVLVNGMVRVTRTMKAISKVSVTGLNEAAERSRSGAAASRVLTLIL